jgi:hypothetical protein
MRRSAIRRKSRDGGKESGQGIHVFDRRIRAKGKACTIVDNIAECVEQLHTFLALRAVDKRRGTTHKSYGHTSRSLAKCMSLILIACNTVSYPWNPWHETGSRVGWLDAGDDWFMA